MEIIKIYRNVESGQCKGTLLQIQIRLTVIHFFSGMKLFWKETGFCGSKIGLFAPIRHNGWYKFSRFYFHPWFAPDVAVVSLPVWYINLIKKISFDVKL